MFFVLIAKIGVGQLCEGTTVVLIDSINYNVPVNWVLAFDEEFNGDSLDLTQWNLSVSSQGSSDGTGAYFSLDNVKVSRDEFFGDRTSATGVCKIIAKKETVTKYPVNWNHSIVPVTYHYTSASIESKQQYGWGKYEIRCKIPKGKGFWPAFWLYGELNGNGDEVDIFEFMNEKNIFGDYDEKKLSKGDQMHYHRWEKSNPNANVDHNCGYTFESKADFSQDYHTYTFIWNKFEMDWYVDGEFIKEAAQWYNLTGEPINIYNVQPRQVVIRNDWYPKNPMTIIFGFGLQHGNDEPSDNSPFPSSLDIDYIRYYSY